MYQPSLQFPQITNRESWTQLVGVYDDATGDPISLTNTGGQGTFASWAIQIAATLYGATLINSSSVTPLTIGDGSFSATIDPGLAITPGQSVTLLAHIDNINFMQGQVTAYNPANGALAFKVATVAINLEIRRVEGHRHGNSGYGPNYSLGSYDCSEAILKASIGNGIEIVGAGFFQVYFAETSMRSLGPGMHSVNAILASADGVDVRQLFLGRLPVFAGGVTG